MALPWKFLAESQVAFTFSKLTIKTLEQDVKYVKNNNKDTMWLLPQWWVFQLGSVSHEHS